MILCPDATNESMLRTHCMGLPLAGVDNVSIGAC